MRGRSQCWRARWHWHLHRILPERSNSFSELEGFEMKSKLKGVVAGYAFRVFYALEREVRTSALGDAFASAS
jgi:hypothetical protein